MSNPENKSNKKDFNLDHAWKYFELHANQRISLIRFFIILLSLYVTGSAYLIAKINDKGCIEEYGVIFFSIGFFFITIIFWFLDSRNRKLIHIAECSLRKYEEDNIIQYRHKIFNREKDTSCYSIRHTHCFRALFVIAIISTFIIACFAWHHICR